MDIKRQKQGNGSEESEEEDEEEDDENDVGTIRKVSQGPSDTMKFIVSGENSGEKTSYFLSNFEIGG